MRGVTIQTIERGSMRVLTEEHYASETLGAALDKHAPDPSETATFIVFAGPPINVVEKE